MLKKLWILVLAGLLGVWGIVACDDDPEPTDGDADTDSDTDSDTDGDADGDPDGDTPEGWPCTQASADTPQLRLTALQISAPAALAGIVGNILSGAIDDFQFVWLMDIDIAGSTMNTGGGMPADSAPEYASTEFCQSSWNSGEYAPINDVGISVNGNTFSTSDPIEDISIPVYSEDNHDTPLVVLPLSHLSLTDVEMNADHTLVGEPAELETVELAADWSPAGTLEAYISFENSAGIDISVSPTMSMNLCTILCGNNTDCSTVTDPATECSTVDIPGTDPVVQGYMLTADIGAAAITIQ